MQRQHLMERSKKSMEDEVLWLHSLWHIGPPGKPTKKSNSLAIKSPPRFKKNKKRNNSKEIEWPCDSSSDPLPSTGPEWTSWANAPPPPSTSRRNPTCEEIAHFNALQVQQKGISASKDFFATNDSSDDDDDEDMDDEEVESGFLGLYLDMFDKDADLCGYYKKNHEKGEFYCLVCAGLGKKVHKTFGDCTSLVLHAHSISKTKRREAHRAYAKVMCQVLGWDAERLPTIICSVNGGVKHSSSEASSLKSCSSPHVIQNALNDEEHATAPQAQLYSSSITSEDDEHVDAILNSDEEELVEELQ